MSATRWLVASVVVALIGPVCSASDKCNGPDITIILQRPKGEFVLGKPIQLTVVFQNNLKRDVRIDGFAPEAGYYTGGHRLGGGAVTSRIVRATTEISVERLSGKSKEDDASFPLEESEARSFLLKAGGSKEHSFDLMQTILGPITIDSPGRFKVSLVFKVKGKASKDYQHDSLEWEGESRASPIEINVIGVATAAERPK